MSENALCPRADAIRRIIAYAASLPDKRSDDSDVYPVIWISKQQLGPGGLRFGCQPDTPIEEPHRDGSWVAMVDLYPDCNWSHDCVYLLLDPGGSVREQRAHWYPHDWEAGWTAVTTQPPQTFGGNRGTPLVPLPGGRGAWHLSWDAALELVQDALPGIESANPEIFKHPRAEPRLYLSRAVYPPGPFRLGVGELPAAASAGEQGSWVAFLDPLRSANFTHPCFYLFVDRDGKVRVIPNTWYPRDWEGQYALVEYKPSAAEH